VGPSCVRVIAREGRERGLLGREQKKGVQEAQVY